MGWLAVCRFVIGFFLVAALTAAAYSVYAMGLLLNEPAEESADNYGRFVTVPGSGPDKWASIWLIERFIDPGVRVRLVDSNVIRDYSDDKNAVVFDVPNSEFERDFKSSTFEKLLSHYVDTDHPQYSALQFLLSLIDDIEINTWEADEFLVSRFVESEYRRIQRHFDISNPDSLYQCYMSFFSDVFTYIDQNEISVRSNRSDSAAYSYSGDMHLCGNANVEEVNVVRELSTVELKRYFKEGKNIIFVDVREPEEFEEVRIPGAINILLRDVNHLDLDELSGADLIVPYCVKDFRGYEMALKLRQKGFSGVAIMRPFGLKGWRESSLPVYVPSSSKRSEDDIKQAMVDCFSAGLSCAENSKHELSSRKKDYAASSKPL